MVWNCLRPLDAACNNREARIFHPVLLNNLELSLAKYFFMELEGVVDRTSVPTISQATNKAMEVCLVAFCIHQWSLFLNTNKMSSCIELIMHGCPLKVRF